MQDSYKTYLAHLLVRSGDRIVAVDHWWQEADSAQTARNLAKRRVKAMGYSDYVYELLILPEDNWGDPEIWPVVRPLNPRR